MMQNCLAQVEADDSVSVDEAFSKLKTENIHKSIYDSALLQRYTIWNEK